MTLTMGFIGFGKSANRYHLPYVNTRNNIKIKTIFVRQINEKLAAPYKEKGVYFTTDLDELLNDKEIQVVTVCTPAHTHYELAKKLYLLESQLSLKTILRYSGTCERIISFRTRKGVVVMPYQNRRFDGDF